MNLKEVSKKFESKLQKIKFLLVDVDGIMTDGKLYYSGQEIGFNRFFNVYDGFGIKSLLRLGIPVGILSGGNSLGLKMRIEELGVQYAKLGNEDKRRPYLDLLAELSLKDEEVIYIGDELFDIPILKRVGFSATVPSAAQEVKDVVDYITQRDGGQGCVREIIDIFRYAKGIEFKVPDFD